MGYRNTTGAREKVAIEAVAVYGVSSLAEAAGILSGQLTAEPMTAEMLAAWEDIEHA